MDINDVNNMSEEDIKKTIESLTPEEVSSALNQEETNPNSDELVNSTSSSNEEKEATENTSSGSQESQEEEVDYVDFYNKVHAPLKGAGTEFQIKNADEAISLMQKGIDYTRKTQELSKNRKQIDLLNQNNITDLDQLVLYIDAGKGNIEAIKKILDNNNLDPSLLYELDNNEYSPKINLNALDDQRTAFNDSIQKLDLNSERGQILYNVLNNIDDKSKAILYSNPLYIDTLNEANNIQSPLNSKQSKFETINEEVARRKALDIIPANMSYLDAYVAVEREIDAKYPPQIQQQQFIQPNNGRVINNNNKAKSASIQRGSSAGSAIPNELTPNRLTIRDINNMSDSQVQEYLKKYGLYS